MWPADSKVLRARQSLIQALNKDSFAARLRRRLYFPAVQLVTRTGHCRGDSFLNYLIELTTSSLRILDPDRDDATPEAQMIPGGSVYAAVGHFPCPLPVIK
jgi:hypothetical protein